MMYKNGFFQLVIKEDGTYLRIFPPKAGGKRISYQQVLDYLESQKIFGVDTNELNRQIESAKDITEIKINSEENYPADETMIFSITPDNMQAIARFYPPSVGGSLLTIDSVERLLKQQGVRAKVSRKRIKDFLMHRQYNTPVVIAEGRAAVHGQDAVIEYHFDTQRKPKPKLNEDGTVDFHHLDAINHVEAGACLATLTKETEGEKGEDLLGNILVPRKVKRLRLKFGRNISLSSDECEIYADVAGHVKLEGDKVFVSDTFEVLSDVDTATGDIEYEGNIEIKGNVRTGFTVRASGDISVSGVVEGAELYAGGQIVIKRGMQGMNKGVLDAKGNVYVKFIENATVTAGGGIVTEAIMHSDVTALGDIVVDGKKGLITGGSVSSRTEISLRVGGSDMGTSTRLEVGADPKILEESRMIVKAVPELRAAMEKHSKVVDLYKKKLANGDKLSSEKMLALKEATKGLKKASEEFAQKQERLEILQEKLEANSQGVIRVNDKLYPGVQVCISDIQMYVREETHYCRMVRDGADIRCVAL